MVSTRGSRTPSVRPEPQGVNPTVLNNAPTATAPRSPARNRRKSPSPAPVRRTRTKRDAATPVVSRAEPLSMPGRSGLARNSRSRSASVSRIPGSKMRRGGSAQPEEGTRRLLDALPEDRKARFTQRPHALSDVSERSGVAPSEHSTAPFSRALSITGSQLELNDLDPEVIRTVMPSLEQQASLILKLLVLDNSNPKALRTKLRQPNSKEARNFNTYQAMLRACVNAFSSTEYINPEIVKRALGTYRYSPVLFKANLALLACNIFVAEEDSPQTREKLKEVQREFPGFIGHNIDKNNISIALDLRTHSLILALVHHQDQEHYDPRQFLHTTFFEDLEENESEDGDGIVRGWKEWDVIEDGEWKVNAAKRRCHEILQAYSERTVDFEKLTETFSWEDFVQKMVDYIKATTFRLDKLNIDTLAKEAKESDGQIGNDYRQPAINFGTSRVGGVGVATTSQSLQRVVGAGNKPFGAAIVKQLEERRKSQNGQVVKTKADFTLLKQVEQKLDTERRDGERSFSLPLNANDSVHDYQGSEAGDAEGGLHSPQPPATKPDVLVERYNDGQMEKNKENRALPPRRRYIDPQPNAKRLEFDESQELAPSQIRPRNKGKKRAAPEDNSDDDDFHQDVREENAERRKRSRRDIPATQDVQKHFAVGGRQSSVNASQQLQIAGPANVGLRAPRREPSVAPENNGDNMVDDVDELFEDDNQQDNRGSALEKVQMFANIAKAAAAPRFQERKGRVKWSEEATKTLIMQIAIYGPKWAYIRDRQLPELVGQNNVNLKDKARNIKVNWMMSMLPLPPHFADVGLGEKEIQRVLRVHPDLDIDSYPEVGLPEGQEYVLDDDDIPPGVM